MKTPNPINKTKRGISPNSEAYTAVVKTHAEVTNPKGYIKVSKQEVKKMEVSNFIDQPKLVDKTHGVGTKSCSIVKKTTNNVKITLSNFIDLPRIVNESIKIALLEMNHKVSTFLLDLYYSKAYEELKKKHIPLFIFEERINDMSVKISRKKKEKTELETYGAKTVRNSKYASCEKLIEFYKDFTTKLSDFIREHKITTTEGIALAIECKCCKKYLNLHAIKEYIDYDSYCKIRHLIDKKNCHIKIINRKEAKKRFGRCKNHIETLQHTLF